jgi:nitroimidazol reductase NimA-like FMN-containing flavoprotein (pyridoxamine 5'-phosphate oxidase superfamily)
MMEPTSARPHMPGYGIAGPGEGTGLLPWSWAVDRLSRSHDYWVTSVWPDGRPHTMPVWGVWLDDALWFSSSLGSRKARNLAADPRCTVATDDAQEPVVVEGRASIVRDVTTIEHFLEHFLEHSNAKYETSYEIDFLDPDTNATIRVTPARAIGLVEADFTASPTRWTFT